MKRVMELEYLGLTDVGMVRKQNEDAFFCDGQKKLFIVCDGIGGHVAGQLASSLAVDSFRQYFFERKKYDKFLDSPAFKKFSAIHKKMIGAINTANLRIIEESKNNGHLKGMGTTMVTLYIKDKRAYIANVGDSRCYRLRDEQFEQLTSDHSLVMERVRKGDLTIEEARNHPQKHIITRALGIRKHVIPDLYDYEVKPGDLFLLCSDGLSDCVIEEEIAAIFEAFCFDLTNIAKGLIELACDRGGPDNITVVLVYCQPDKRKYF